MEEENMKKIAVMVCLALLSASAAFAEDAKPTGLNVDDVKKALGLSIYLQGGYTYNADAGTPPGQDSEQNDLRVFDHKANSFTLDLAQIVFQKDPAALGSAGFKLKISAGETAKWIHSRGLSGAPLDQPQTGEGTDAFDLTEAYVSYNAAVGKGLRLDLGKFVTFLGAEVIEAIDNPDYSRSFLFNYAIPFTHTGLRASYALTDTLNAAVYLVNGWDNSTDNNRGKSIGLSVGYTPVEAFSILVNGITGAEQDETGPNAPTVGSSSSNKRSLLDIVATIKPTKKLSFILNTDNAREQNVIYSAAPAILLGQPTGQATWAGYAAIVKYDLSDANSVSVRGEVFSDPEGFRTGTIQRLKEATLTWETRLSNGIIIRPEYRHDHSDSQVFDYVGASATKNYQNTIALGVMYRW
jgi:hypothetical protein